MTFGTIRDLSSKMPSKYDPEIVEGGIYQWWKENGFFELGSKTTGTKSDSPLTMVIPPPNVTGKLHIGHALMCTIEDCLVRWSRMNGRPTLWVPGVDHAGIATQNVVERQLVREKKLSRFDMSREKFVEEVWKWKKTYGSKIFQQIERLGASVDWSREFFTLDETRSRAVTTAFVRLHQKGKIFKARRFVNWSSALTTAIADCEVEKEEFPKSRHVAVTGNTKKVEFGVIHKFSYKFVDSDEEVLIETTRPETMLGDVAIAVHPEDQRYKNIIGKFVRHPFLDRKMPVLADSVLVDMEKGTGVVKITPAHDENDFECGERHCLESITVFDEFGRINENGGEYKGMMRFDCRYKIIKDLEKRGQYYGKRNFNMIVSRCSRSGDVIEPINTLQWFLDCDEVAKQSLECVKKEELIITPKREEKTFFNFLENIRPWCLSRQLWWGHRIPAYLPIVGGKPLDREEIDSWIVAETREKAMEIAKKRYGKSLTGIEQDEDVLDTWFSSALLPFSVFGWPEKSADLEKHYPNTILETGSDILFFWVARMVFLSLMVNKVLPFKEILLHPMVRASDGSKMSKSKGNVIDPLEVIDGVSLEDFLSKLDTSNLSPKEIEIHKRMKKRDFPNGIPRCGSDALRFGLLCYLKQGRSINLDVNRVIGYRLFCNKIWQAANFVYPKLEDEYITKPQDLTNNMLEGLQIRERWIFNQLRETVATVVTALEAHDFATAVDKVYNFFLHEFCDVYLELVKPVFNDRENRKRQREVRGALYIVFEHYLRLLHPFMPFISEELYQRLPKGNSSEEKNGVKTLMLEDYPMAELLPACEKAKSEMQLALRVVKGIRSAKMLYGIGNAKVENVFIESEKKHERLKKLTDCISVLSRVLSVKVLPNLESSENLIKSSLSQSCSKDVIDSEILVRIDLGKVSNIKQQYKKIAKRKAVLQSRIEKLNKSLNDEKRCAKTPENIIEKEIKLEKDLSKELNQLNISLEHLERFKTG